MPRVLRLLNRLNIGGPTHNAVYLTRYLAPEFETLLVAGAKDATEGDSTYIAQEHGLAPLYLKDMRRQLSPVADYRAYRELVGLIQQFKPHIVHTHAAKAGAVGRLAAMACKVPVVVHTFHGHVFHSYFSPLKTTFFLRVERYLASRSTGIVAVSASQQQELASTYRIAPQEKIRVIPNGFDLTRFTLNQAAHRAVFRKRYGVEEGTLALGIIGRLVPVKNHSLFLRAIAQLRQTWQGSFKAFIIGDGEEREALQQQATQLGLRFGNAGDSLVFTSWLTAMEEVYAGLDIVLLTSLNEGTPVSLIEAQAAACPVVSTNVGGVQDVVVHGQGGLLVPSQATEALLQATLSLMGDANLRKQMGAAGRNYVLARYGYERLVHDMGNYYHELLAQHS